MIRGPKPTLHPIEAWILETQWRHAYRGGQSPGAALQPQLYQLHVMAMVHAPRNISMEIKTLGGVGPVALDPPA
jgi:hypothetical protein